MAWKFYSLSQIEELVDDSVADYDEIIKILQHLQEIETMEVQPVLHGRWERYEQDIGLKRPLLWKRCSVCYWLRRGETPYCPNCGAKMDGGM